MYRIYPNAQGAIAYRSGLRIDPHRALRSAVGGMAAGATDKAHDRTDVDDRAATGLRHLLGGELGAEKDTGLIDRDHPLPAFQAIGISNRAAGDPSVVHQDVEPAVMGHGLGNKGHPLGLTGDIDRVVLMRPRKTEIGQNPVALELGDEAVVARDDAGNSVLVGA